MGIKESTALVPHSLESLTLVVLLCSNVKLSIISVVLHFEQQRLHSFGRQSGPPCSGDGSTR